MKDTWQKWDNKCRQGPLQAFGVPEHDHNDDGDNIDEGAEGDINDCNDDADDALEDDGDGANVYDNDNVKDDDDADDGENVKDDEGENIKDEDDDDDEDGLPEQKRPRHLSPLSCCALLPSLVLSIRIIILESMNANDSIGLADPTRFFYKNGIHGWW